jgi:hypothetical protein
MIINISLSYTLAHVSDEQWLHEVRNLYYSSDNSTRGVAVYMYPSIFLSLASDSGGDASRRAKEYGAFDNAKFTSDWLPSLNIDSKDKVTQHEGRARAEMCIMSDIAKMPVILIFEKDDRKQTFDQVPEFITAQKSGGKIKIVNPTLMLYGTNNPFK